MASRKEQKDAARARREELAERHAAEDQRKRRLSLLLAIGGIAIVIVVAVIAAGSGGGSGTSGLATGSKAAATGRQVDALLRGLPQSGTRLGSPSAPVTMTYFSDLECPVCRAFTLDAFGQVIDQEVRSGKLQVQYRSLQTATPDPATFQRQQVAALAAGKQNRLWQYVELFYRQQGQEGTAYATDAYLSGLARQVPGLDIARWKTAQQDASLSSQVRTDATAASVAGANATPTLVIKGPKGTKTLAGLVSASAVEAAVTGVSA
jgi:protein-disulfide isomerase